MDTAVKFLVLTIAVVTVAFAVIREGLNYLNYPSLQIIRYPADRREIVIYHRGSSQRKATLFVRKLDPKASPVKIADLNYKDTIAPAAEEDPLMGKLSWTADGTAVVAMGRETRSEPDPPPLWIYDVGSYTLYSPGKFRSGQIMGQEHIDAILKVKGGVGHPIAQWYQLGKKENYVFSWKAHHWNRLCELPPPRAAKVKFARIPKTPEPPRQ